MGFSPSSVILKSCVIHKHALHNPAPNRALRNRALHNPPNPQPLALTWKSGA